ncbi:MAG: flagellar hook-length control protein FliK [Defluviicoccus sp.]|nr:MAG: flagellar hook-length control protein FliK [Defluviicoccus sp.]
MNDGQPSGRDARSAAIVPDGTQDGNLARGDTEDSFAAVATPVTRSGTLARTAGSSTTAAANPASPAAQIAQHLGKAANSGLQRVEIALEPAALGHVDVRLDFGRDGRIAAHFIADTREALNALQADTHSLQRALQDAGVQADAGSLGFSLRGETGGEHRSSFASRATPAPARARHE